MAILKHGQLVAQAPIEELLTGNNGVVYNLIFKGSANGTLARVTSQPWVSAVNVLPNSEGATTWQISVTDQGAAETHLLRLVMEAQAITVTEFGHKKYDLEEVFMSMVGEEHHVR